ncbi:MAG: NAD(+)/NADH kinase [Balneolaceae bacterium]
MNICTLANPEKYSVQEPLKRVLNWCNEQNTEVYLAQHLAKHFPDLTKAKTVHVTETEPEALDNAEIVIAIGGDGTMLHTAHLLKNNAKPVLGINTGKLGFMANVQPEHIESALFSVKKKKYIIDKRFLFQAVANGDTYYALNEFLFTKKDTSSLIRLEAEYDGNFINNYWADGLIISTPTGSTAYNLSAGGPIVLPNTPVMVVTPINPHTLTTRPLVLPSDRIITIRSEENPEHILFSYDGVVMPVKNELNIEITRSDFSIHIIQLPDHNYFETLRNKLMWGLDKRKE